MSAGKTAIKMSEKKLFVSCQNQPGPCNQVDDAWVKKMEMDHLKELKSLAEGPHVTRGHMTDDNPRVVKTQ